MAKYKSSKNKNQNNSNKFSGGSTFRTASSQKQTSETTPLNEKPKMMSYKAQGAMPKSESKKFEKPSAHNIKSILKHTDNFYAMKKVSEWFKPLASNKWSVSNMTKETAKEINQLSPIFEKRSISEWENYAGVNYAEDGVHAPTAMFNANGEMLPNIKKALLNQLESRVDHTGKMQIDFSFYPKSNDESFGNDDKFYETLLNMPKQVVGMVPFSMFSDNDQNINMLVRLLVGEREGKKYIFTQTVRSYDDVESMSNSLALLVNGKVEGYKQILRADICGLQPIDLVEGMGQNYNIKDESYKLFSKTAIHPNNISPDMVDEKLKDVSAAQSEHLHYITAFQDKIINAAYLVAKQNGVLKFIRNPLNSLNAKNINIYSVKGKDTNQMLEDMKSDVEKKNALVPYSRIINYVDSISNVSNGELPEAVINQYDDARSYFRQGVAFSANFIMDQYLEDIGYDKNILLARSQKIHLQPRPHNLFLNPADKIQWEDKVKFIRDEAINEQTRVQRELVERTNYANKINSIVKSGKTQKIQVGPEMPLDVLKQTYHKVLNQLKAANLRIIENNEKQKTNNFVKKDKEKQNNNNNNNFKSKNRNKKNYLKDYYDKHMEEEKTK